MAVAGWLRSVAIGSGLLDSALTSTGLGFLLVVLERLGLTEDTWWFFGLRPRFFSTNRHSSSKRSHLAHLRPSACRTQRSLIARHA